MLVCLFSAIGTCHDQFFTFNLECKDTSRYAYFRIIKANNCLSHYLTVFVKQNISRLASCIINDIIRYKICITSSMSLSTIKIPLSRKILTIIPEYDQLLYRPIILLLIML